MWRSVPAWMSLLSNLHLISTPARNARMCGWHVWLTACQEASLNRPPIPSRSLGAWRLARKPRSILPFDTGNARVPPVVQCAEAVPRPSYSGDARLDGGRLCCMC